MGVIYFMLICMATRIPRGPIIEVWLQTYNQGTVRSDNTINIYDYYTKLDKYGKLPSEDNTLIIEVKACRDSCMLLSSSRDLVSSTFYEICFSEIGRRIVIFRKLSNGTIITSEYLKTGILKCDNFTKIWAIWNSDTIFTGYASDAVEANSVLSFHDSQPFVIQGTGIKTGFTINGVWKMNITVFPTGFYCGLRTTRGDMLLLTNITQHIRTLCALKCLHSDECLGFNFRADGIWNCQLIAGGQLVKTEANYDWTFYSKCLQDRNVCIGCR